MSKKLMLIFLLLISGASFSQIASFNQDDLLSLLEGKDDTIVVVNFWATWCKPCVEELPVFDTLMITNYGVAIELHLLSLDFESQIKERLIPFVEEHKISPFVQHLNAGNPNDWIDKVNENWSGAIPATYIVAKSNNQKFFLEGELSFPKLDSLINRFK